MSKDTHILNHLNAVPNFRWMHVCPLGEHPWTSADGKERIIQVIDKEACELMAKSYPLDVPNSRIDLDHESMDADKLTASYGWGQRAEAREDGLWVEVEWNPKGHELVVHGGLLGGLGGQRSADGIINACMQPRDFVGVLLF